MSPVRVLLPGLAGIIVGTVIAALALDDADPTGPPPSEDSVPREVERLTARIDELRAELAAAHDEEALLRAELARARRAPADRADPAAAAPPSSPALFGPRGGARTIRSLDEAQAAYDRAIAAGDLEALWLLGADLLAFGEQGYPLFEKLLAQFIGQGEGSGEGMRRQWNEEELWMGRFMRALAEDHAGFLAYSLHLAERDPAELDPSLEGVRREIFDDEFLPVLLGFHRGEDPELTAGWLDHFQYRMSLPDLGGADPETIIFAIAQLPGDRSADLLAEWIGTRTDHTDKAIEALLLQGSARALEVLRGLLPLIDDEALRAAVERRLGG